MKRAYDFNRTLFAYIVAMLLATIVLRILVLHARHR